MNRGSGGGSDRASSYGEQGGYPTQESLDDIAREVNEEDTISSRTKKDHRTKKALKFMAKTVVAQKVHLATLVKANDFESALGDGTVYTQANAWSVVRGDVVGLTTYVSKVDGGLASKADALFHQVFDRMSYEGLGLARFDANETLGAAELSKVLSSDCVQRVMGLASGKALKRQDVRALLSYLLYFGIGGPSRSAAVQKLRWHLNGRCSNTRADPALNFKVDQDASPCFATIFEVEETQKPVEFEQKGIEFVQSATAGGLKHTNCNPSTASSISVPTMFYYMLFVANPEFDAEQVRLSKAGGLSNADEIIAGKLREQGYATTITALRDAMKAGGITGGGNKTKIVLIHCMTEMLAQLSEAGLDESAGGSSGGAGGGSSNRSTTVVQLLSRASVRRAAAGGGGGGVSEAAPCARRGGAGREKTAQVCRVKTIRVKAIMYECICGWAPFYSDSPRNTVGNIIHWRQTLKFPKLVAEEYSPECSCAQLS
jgi:hypothetical protein